MLCQLGLLLGFLIVLVPLQLIVTKIRMRVWVSCMFKGGNRPIKRFTRYLNEHWGAIFLLEMFVVFLYVTISIATIFGEDKLLEGLIFSVALIIFLTFQFPRLMKPNIFISFLPSKDNSYTDITDLEKPISELVVKPNIVYRLYFHIVNLGINNYEDCGVWFSLEKPIEAILTGTGIKQVGTTRIKDSDSGVTYEKQKNWLHFPPSGKFSFGPANVLIRDFEIKTPSKEDKYYIDIEVSCATRWGTSIKRLYLSVKDKH